MAKRFLTPIGIVNLASDPATGSEGEIYFNSTDDILKIYVNGSWTPIEGGGGAAINVSASAPTSPTEGDAWFDNTDGTFYVYDGSFWVEAAQPLNAQLTYWTENQNGNLLPNIDNIYSIGASAYRVKDLYLGASSLYIQSTDNLSNNLKIASALNNKITINGDEVITSSTASSTYATKTELNNIDLTSTINTASAAAFASASAYTDSAIASFEALPSQTGNAGKYLSTSGSVTSWQELDLNAAINTASAAAVDYADNTFLPKTGGLISGDLELEGNLTISGSTSYINSTDLQINDPLIYLAVSPSAIYNSDILDVGFTAAYGPHPSGGSAHYHRGLVFDITDDKWKLFSNAPHPVDNYIDFTSANYDTLKAGTFEGNIDVSNVIGLSATYYTKEEAEKSLLRWSKTYSGSATVISGLDVYDNTLEYTPSYINLYINGILQDPSNYTASSGSTVVLDQAVVNNDVVEILSYNTYTVVNDSYTRAESDNKYLTFSSASSNYLTQSSAATTYEKLIPYSSSAPSSPVQGDLWIDSTVPTIKSYIGGVWTSVGGGAADSDQSILANRIFG